MSIFSRRRKFRNLVSSAISTVVLSSCAPQVAQSFCDILGFDPNLKAIRVEIGLPKFYHDCVYGRDCCNENTFLFNTPSDIGRGCDIRLCSFWLVIDEKSNVRILHDDDFLNETKGKNVKRYPFPTLNSPKMTVPPGETSVSAYMKHIIFKYVLGCRALAQHFLVDKPYDVAKGISRSSHVVKLLDSSSKEYIELSEKLNKQDTTRIEDLRAYSKLIVEFYNKYSYKIRKMLFDRDERALYIIGDLDSLKVFNNPKMMINTLRVKQVYIKASDADIEGNFVEIPEELHAGLLTGEKEVLLKIKKIIYF